MIHIPWGSRFFIVITSYIAAQNKMIVICSMFSSSWWGRRREERIIKYITLYSLKLKCILTVADSDRTVENTVYSFICSNVTYTWPRKVLFESVIYYQVYLWSKLMIKQYLKLKITIYVLPLARRINYIMLTHHKLQLRSLL